MQLQVSSPQADVQLALPAPLQQVLACQPVGPVLAQILQDCPDCILPQLPVQMCNTHLSLLSYITAPGKLADVNMLL